MGGVAGWEKTGRQREVRAGRMRAALMGFDVPGPGGRLCRRRRSRVGGEVPGELGGRRRETEWLQDAGWCEVRNKRERGTTVLVLVRVR